MKKVYSGGRKKRAGERGREKGRGGKEEGEEGGRRAGGKEERRCDHKPANVLM